SSHPWARSRVEIGRFLRASGTVLEQHEGRSPPLNLRKKKPSRHPVAATCKLKALEPRPGNRRVPGGIPEPHIQGIVRIACEEIRVHPQTLTRSSGRAAPYVRGRDSISPRRRSCLTRARSPESADFVSGGDGRDSTAHSRAPG